MAYNINKTNGDALAPIADGSVDYSQVSIGLIGKNHQGYGDEMATNFVHMLEHFANDSVPSNPIAGQLWYNTTGNGSLAVYDGAQWRQLLIADFINGNIIPDTDLAYTIGDSNHRFTDVWATTFNGTATQARYADLAERYEADREYKPGTVVKIGGEKQITWTEDEGDIDVFGVISTNPGLMLNSDAGEDATHPYVALAGQVPVIVVGKVRKGQRLIASNIQGMAEVVRDEEMATINPLAILGRALEDKDDLDVGTVLAVVGAK